MPRARSRRVPAAEVALQRAARREVQNSSIRNLAVRADMPHTTLAHWLDGTNRISIDQAIRLGKAVGLRIDCVEPGRT